MNAHDRRFVLVLDDDPTGTQCAANVDVLLRPDEHSIAAALAGPGHAAFALTNTRALDRGEATALVRRLRALTVHYGQGRDVRLVLRGDSTLRGHVFAEMESLGLGQAAGLIVPAFPAAGRVTIDGVHYLGTGGALVNVADTEFARDPVFGFRARTMRDWVAEVGGSRAVELVGPDVPPADRAAAVRDALLRVPDGGVVIPDVRDGGDLALIAAGSAAAQERGRRVVVRCAAPLAALIAGVPGTTVAPRREPARRVLVVCGSHTAAATEQLDSIRDRTPPHLVVPAEVNNTLACEAVAGAALAHLDRDGIAVVTTERRRGAERGSLADGAAVMAALMAVVRRLAPGVDAIVSKGGITSAELVTTGLGATRTRVVGQLEVGISLWEVPRNGDDGVVPVAIVPGNIGDAGTLARMLGYFTAG